MFFLLYFAVILTNYLFDTLFLFNITVLLI